MNKCKGVKEESKINDPEFLPNKSLRKKKVHKRKGSAKWTNQEYNSLINLVREFGEEWDKIAN